MYCGRLRGLARGLKTHFESGAFNRALPPLRFVTHLRPTACENLRFRSMLLLSPRRVSIHSLLLSVLHSAIRWSPVDGSALIGSVSWSSASPFGQRRLRHPADQPPLPVYRQWRVESNARSWAASERARIGASGERGNPACPYCGAEPSVRIRVVATKRW